MQHAARIRETGFSLIEVLVSLGLLAGVIVAISSLFLFGGRQVYSGREMTEAYSVAQDITEELDRMTYTQAYRYFLPTAADSSTDTNYTVDTSVTGALSAAAEVTRDGYQTVLDEKLLNGKALIKAEGLDTTGTAAVLDNSIALRVTVTIEWDEGTHHRYLHLRSVRF